MPDTRTQFQREIDGRTWTVVLFTGRESLAVFRQLMALVGEPFAQSVATVVGQLSDDAEFSAVEALKLLGGAVGLAGRVAASLTDDQFEGLVKRLLKFTQCDGRAIAFDAAFQGGLPTLFKVVAFVVEVNFADPFKASLGPAVSSVFDRLGAGASTLQPS